MGRPINYTLFSPFVKDFSLSDLEIHAGVALEVGAELIVLAGEDGVHHNAHDGGGGKAGEAEDTGEDTNSSSPLPSFLKGVIH